MAIGYACISVGLLNSSMKKCLLKNATGETLKDITKNNILALERQIDYNIHNNIHMFRISSDLIPFGSSPVNKLDWPNLFKTELNQIAEKIKTNNIRVSMHPGQYTVLNSLNEETVKNAIADLSYHALVLDSLKTDNSNKIILHVGGVYGDKKTAMQRFIENYQTLAQNVKDRLVIENDDKSYTITDVLSISQQTNVPVVYDNLHNYLNPSSTLVSDQYWIDTASKTWQKKDGKQKIHYSQLNPNKKSGSHSETIMINEFKTFYDNLANDVDIMLEVKDKNISALKCINTTSNNNLLPAIEKEWSRYKYLILSKSQTAYIKIRELLKNFDNDKVLVFYNTIEQELALPEDKGNQINAAQHVWGYFKDLEDDKQRLHFVKLIDDYLEDKVSIKKIKNYLYRLAINHNNKYLLDSYYFYL